MSRRPARRAAADRTMLLAGWLFADLLLLLLVVALGSLPREERTAGKEPIQPPSSSPPGDDSEVAERGLVLKPCSFTVKTGGAGYVIRQFTSKLRAADVEHRTAGFVLSFGTARDPGPGQAAAERVNGVITRELSRFKQAPKKGYWKGGQAGSVRIDVFFLADSDGDTRLPPGCRSSEDG